MLKSSMAFLYWQKRILLDKDTALRCWHATVSSITLVCVISTVCCLVFTEVQPSWEIHPFAVRGSRYCHILLSFWVSAGQVIYFNIYLAIDILDVYSKRNPKLLIWKERLHNIGSYLLFMVIFPLSMLVTVLFWTFYFWKRDEMYPTFMDEVFPKLLNHAMHTFPVILAVIFMFTSNQRVPPKVKALTGLATIMTVYGACAAAIKIKDGLWIYYVLDGLTPLQLKVTLGFTCISPLVFLHLGYLINDKMRALRKKLQPE